MEATGLASADTQRAKSLLTHGARTCVLVRDDAVLESTRRGVAPLLGWLDEGVDASGYSAADRVVGNGAAFLYVLLGVREVYGAVMSISAKGTLERFGIGAEAGELVDHIVNRDKTGYCPMEQAVSGIEDPHEARRAIVRRLAELSGVDATARGADA